MDDTLTTAGVFSATVTCKPPTLPATPPKKENRNVPILYGQPSMLVSIARVCVTDEQVCAEFEGNMTTWEV